MAKQWQRVTLAVAGSAFLCVLLPGRSMEAADEALATPTKTMQHVLGGVQEATIEVEGYGKPITLVKEGPNWRIKELFGVRK